MFLQWLRHVDHAKLNPKPYKDGSTLVATKIHSIFNQQDFFSARCCISAIETLLNLTIIITTMFQNNCSVFAQALHYFPNFWSDKEHLTTFFTARSQGNICKNNNFIHSRFIRSILSNANAISKPSAAVIYIFAVITKHFY